MSWILKTVGIVAMIGVSLGLLYSVGLHRRAYLLSVSNESSTIEVAMFVSQTACNEVLQQMQQDSRKEIDEARNENPKVKTPKISFQCNPENAPSVPAEWRASSRTKGIWWGQSVYYYHAAEPQNLSGAFVFATPKAEHWNSDVEVSDIFVDRKTCDAELAASKKLYADELDLQRDAEHDAKLRAKHPHLDETLKNFELAADGACIPIENATLLVRDYCRGLPIKLMVGLGEARYDCDSQILRPPVSQPQDGQQTRKRL